MLVRKQTGKTLIRLLLLLLKQSDLGLPCFLGFYGGQLLFEILEHFLYSKTCLKQPLKNRQNKDINGKW